LRVFKKFSEKKLIVYVSAAPQFGQYIAFAGIIAPQYGHLFVAPVVLPGGGGTYDCGAGGTGGGGGTLIFSAGCFFFPAPQINAIIIINSTNAPIATSIVVVSAAM